jgi:OPA family glycerol-3-phosphate transporter-like MFS transporter/OPA family sugar phosphate sensor protein UhpC-like MFS transporter
MGSPAHATEFLMARVLSALRTQEDSPVTVADPVAIDRAYRYWRFRILAVSIFGYALYYFVRTNISVPLKAMGDALHYSKAQLGMITSIGGVAYGVSKFLNGLLGDHANPRYFMAAGLLLCAAMNVMFGASSTLLAFGIIWFLNNYFQGMGFPPCAKSMAHWFSPRERSTTFGIWHSSHMIGNALVGTMTGYLVHYLGWRSCFYVPAGLAAFAALVVVAYLRDTPGSMGLPPVEIYKGEETVQQLREELGPEMTYGQIVVKYILKSPFMWVISTANLFTYILRYAQVTWGPTFLQETKGMSVVASGWLSGGSEIGGMVGAILAGVAADRLFNGRAGRVCVIAMAAYMLMIWVFWSAPKSAAALAGGSFVMMGFLLYVPQMLIASMAMTLGTKRASAAAVGLTGIIGYFSQIVTGWGIGHLVDRHGWPAAFGLMFACAGVTLVLMAITWNIGAHPQLERKRPDPTEAAPVAA